MAKVELSVRKAKEMRGTMNTAASFIKELYKFRGDKLWGIMYAEGKIEDLKRHAKALDRQIKELEKQ